MKCASPLRRRVVEGSHSALLLALALLVPRAANAAETAVPNPQLAYHPGVNSILYFDFATARQTEIWTALAAQFVGFESQMAALGTSGGAPPGFDQVMTALDRLNDPALQGFMDLELAELIVVSEGDTSGSNLSQVNPNDSFLVTARLANQVEDQDALIDKLMSLLNEHETGLGTRMAATRTREGAAEMFEVPASTFGNQALPFPVSFAVGPGEQGSMLALGRTDRLKDFLAGRTSGELPPKVQTLLPSRGQLWLYSAIPPNLGQAMKSSGGAGLDSPAAAPILQMLDGLRDLAFNASFGPKAVDLQVVLGCTTATVASQFAQQTEAAFGMMKMMAGGSGGKVPGFVNRLRSAASGELFKISTVVSTEDLRSPGAGAGRGSVSVTPLPDNVPPAEIEFLELLPADGSHLRRARLRIKNLSDHAIEELRLTYEYRDARGARIGVWTRQQRDPLSAVMVRPKATREMEVPVFNVPLRTERVTVTIDEVGLTGAAKWVAPR